MDAVDAVAVQFDGNRPKMLGSIEIELPIELKERLLSLCSPGANEIDLMGALDIEIGELFADAANALLKHCQLDTEQVVAIGSHGQTIRHRPPNTQINTRPFTLQIGDPNTICHRTGITTVADFRRRDMAAGGQGAPLVPAFHKAIFGGESQSSAVINIGGVANVTLLPNDGSNVTGFDTGPGNALMDAWSHQHTGNAIDMGGNWARSGELNTSLLALLLADSYFAQQPPKSTGREAFNMTWLRRHLAQLPTIAPEDVQMTLLELTAVTIADAVANALPSCQSILVCGGGAFNNFLMERLQHHCNASIQSTSAYGICPKQVEACAFAWMAREVIKGRPAGMSSVTGASRNTLLGGIYPSERFLNLLI